MSSGKRKPSLDDLLLSYRNAQRDFREKLASTAAPKPGENVAKQIRHQIMTLYPEFFPKLKEIEISQAMDLLKTEGYKILKRVETVEYEEI